MIKKIFLFFITLFIYVFLYRYFYVETIKLNPNSIIIKDFNEDFIKDRNKYKKEKFEKFSKNENNVVNYSYKDSKKLSEKEMQEDLELFIYLLQTRYALYDKFGGDTEFIKRKNEVLEVIKNKKEMMTSQFIDLLLEKFNNIDDRHFIINGNEIYKEKYYYSYYLYNKTISKKEVENIIEEDKEKYLRKSLDNNGKLKYTFVYQGKEQEKIKKIDIKFKNGSIKQYKLYKVNYFKNKKNSKNFYETEDYYYLTVYDFSKDLNYFDKYEKIIKNKDLILDFRATNGGVESIISPILENYYTETTSLFDVYIKAELNIVPNGSDIRFNWEIINGIKNISKVNKKNNNKIYILIDNHTKSAPEAIIQILKMIDHKNIILLGINTYGSIVSNTYTRPYILPNTNINITFGKLLQFDLVGIEEGVGIYPDIWLDPNDNKFIEKVEKYLKNRF